MNRPVRTRTPGGVEAASEQSGSLYDLVSQPFLHGPWYSTVVEQNETRFADHEV